MTLQINTPSGARDLTSEEQVAARAGLAAAAAADLSAHVNNTSNPHSVTKSQVGLGNVDNTADSAKPVSTAQAAAIAAAITAHEQAADPHPGYLTQAEGDGRYAPAGITGATNLSATASPTGVTVTSDTGTDAALPLADGTNAGLMAPAQVTKLSALPTAADLTTTLAGKMGANADAIADVLEAAATGAPADLARIQTSVSGAQKNIAIAGVKMPRGIGVVLEGDSRTAPSTAGSTANWPKYADKGYWHFALAAMGAPPIRMLNNGAIGGSKTSDVLARIATTTWAYNPDLVVYMCDINDQNNGVTQGVCIANHISIIKGTAVDRGISMIVIGSPGQDGAGALTVKSYLQSTKAAIKNYCEGLPNVVFVDGFAAMNDPATGAFLPGMVYDGTHFTVKGAATLGLAVASACAAKFAKFPLPTFLYDRRYSEPTSRNLNMYPMMTGTGAATGTNVSGVKPDGYNISGHANVTVVSSVIAGDDYSGAGSKWRLQLTASGAGEISVFIQSAPSTGVTAGDQVMCAIGYTVSAAPATLDKFMLNMWSSGDTVARNSSWNFYGGSNGAIPAHSGVAISPGMTLDTTGPAVTLASQFSVSFTGAGSLTLDLGPWAYSSNSLVK